MRSSTPHSPYTRTTYFNSYNRSPNYQTSTSDVSIFPSDACDELHNSHPICRPQEQPETPPPLAAIKAIGPTFNSNSPPKRDSKSRLLLYLATWNFLLIPPEPIYKDTMGAKDVLSRKSGVIVGDDVLKLFNYAQEHKFAIPAIVSLISYNTERHH